MVSANISCHYSNFIHEMELNVIIPDNPIIVFVFLFFNI